MEQYWNEFSELEEKRQDFALAEKLFNLPSTVVSDLLMIQREMAGLQQIYGMYKEVEVSANVCVCVCVCARAHVCMCASVT